MNAVIRWFARNAVASNLLMLLIVCAGVVSLSNIRTELFPTPQLDVVSVDISYPGAGPDEIISNIIIPVEAAVRSVDGIKEISSTASEGVASISVALQRSANADKAVNDVRAAVDGIQSFPSDIERPKVAQAVIKDRIVDIAIYGQLSTAQLTDIGRQIEKDILALPDVSAVSLFAPQREVSIELRVDVLRQYGLTLDNVATAVRSFSVDLPAGSLKATDGDILIRTRDRARTKEDFARIPVVETSAGSNILLGDIATIRDGFTEDLFVYRFDGQNAVGIQIESNKTQDILKAADAVKGYLKRAEQSLPEGVHLQLWSDISVAFNDRLSLLAKNGLGGLLLVFITLMLFMRTSLAFWVSMGIGISFMGTFWMMPIYDVTISIVSTFGFLLVLGIIVDDAIVVGESIHSTQEKGVTGVASVIKGAERVSWPVALGVLTSIVSVSPVLFFESTFGGFLRDISIVIIATLAFSVIECFLILPSHLAHVIKVPSFLLPLENGVDHLRQYAQGGMNYVKQTIYKPLLVKSYKNAGMTCATFLAIGLICLSLVFSGRISMKMEPDFVDNRLVASIHFPENVADQTLLQHLERLEAAFEQANAEIQEATGRQYDVRKAANISQKKITMTLEFLSDNIEELPLDEYTNSWQSAFGDAPQASLVTIQAGEAGAANRVELAMRADSIETLREGLTLMKRELLTLSGVTGISDDADNGRPEISISRTDKARLLGITLGDLSRQIRQAFWGERVDRLPDATKSIDVFVRLDSEERGALSTLDTLPIQVGSGQEIPLHALATLTIEKTFSSVSRINGSLIANSNISIDPGQVSQQQIIKLLVTDILPRIQNDFPDFNLHASGDLRDEQEFSTEAASLFALAILVIYGILAIGAGSYVKPLIILSAIPFGFVGTIIGHGLFDITITLFSAMGVIATAGVVINDNLVLVHSINQHGAQGDNRQVAVIEACLDRFRAISLTSITTCAGLIPLLFETSFQAKMLVPMAVSLSFGVAFCTFVTLLLVPSLYALADAFKTQQSEPAITGPELAENM